MTISILRTADDWWVQTPSGAARIHTDASTTAEVLADRGAIDDAAHSMVNMTFSQRFRNGAAESGERLREYVEFSDAAIVHRTPMAAHGASAPKNVGDRPRPADVQLV